ncbi:MAG TPA: hypothetical protein VFG79_08020 [Solirubrobacter sp.]|nr:hypothetical protein [Solirubrobacter sp.]
MRFRPADLQGIAEGRITLAFRRWERPRVLPGTRLRTPVGELVVEAVDVVETIGDDDARAAGYESADAARAAWAHRGGALHRIALRLDGPDRRIALRSQPPDDALLTRLERMGPWTFEFLRLIAERPAVRAADLAESLGRERLDFKRDVRKLKELGLTESLEVGYRLSPRGQETLSVLPNARSNTSP